MNINEILLSLEEASFSETLAGELTSIDFEVQFSDIDGGSYPSDLMVIVEAPNGNCVVWGGWDQPVPNEANSCDNLGVGGDNFGPTIGIFPEMTFTTRPLNWLQQVLVELARGQSP